MGCFKTPNLFNLPVGLPDGSSFNALAVQAKTNKKTNYKKQNAIKVLKGNDFIFYDTRYNYGHKSSTIELHLTMPGKDIVVK